MSNILLSRYAVLHEIKNDEMGDILLAGVFDGHAGTAASKTCASILPPLFTTELMGTSGTIGDALENAWETTCNTYRGGCDENGECIVDYDPREGILFADTGSKDLVGELLVAGMCTLELGVLIINHVTHYTSLPVSCSRHYCNMRSHKNEPRWYK